MNRAIKILLGAAALDVGTLYFNTSGNRESTAVEYAESWLRSPSRFAIDPSLPLALGRAFHGKRREDSVFHGAIADTEPDGWARRVIQRDFAKRRQGAKRRGETLDATPLTSIDYLLAVDDFSRVGALRFQDEKGIFQRSTQENHRRAPPLIELGPLMRASHAVERNDETAKDLEYLRGRGTSVGGLRPKCTVLDDAGVLHIGKFPSVTDTRSVTKGEVLALRIAAAAGISAAEARLVDSDGLFVALIRRFDRTPEARRIPYMSAVTMLQVEEDADEHAYTEIVDALTTFSADFRTDIEQLWRRVALAILITNVDDHLRNIGFLHVERGKWRLAPAFDVNPFPDRARELKTWISEESGPAASIAALFSASSDFKIDERRARKLLGDVEHAVARWRPLGRELGMSDAELEAFEPAFEHDERDVARRIVAG